MLLMMVRKLLSRRRKGKTAGANPVANSSQAPARSAKREWERELMASLEQNCMVPSEEAILHAFDLFRDDIYGPCLERRHRMADLHAEITADIAVLRSQVPALVDRAMSRHSYEFPPIIDHKDDE